jgi:hypothetical protein
LPNPPNGFAGVAEAGGIHERGPRRARVSETKESGEDGTGRTSPGTEGSSSSESVARGRAGVVSYIKTTRERERESVSMSVARFVRLFQETRTDLSRMRKLRITAKL